jgi:hypothetical protein
MTPVTPDRGVWGGKPEQIHLLPENGELGRFLRGFLKGKSKNGKQMDCPWCLENKGDVQSHVLLLLYIYTYIFWRCAYIRKQMNI